MTAKKGNWADTQVRPYGVRSLLIVILHSSP